MKRVVIVGGGFIGLEMAEALRARGLEVTVVELAEQVMLQIPIKVLCTDACKGLCAHCGMNLNTASCGCHTDFIDERLAVLKKLRLVENK